MTEIDFGCSVIRCMGRARGNVVGRERGGSEMCQSSWHCGGRLTIGGADREFCDAVGTVCGSRKIIKNVHAEPKNAEKHLRDTSAENYDGADAGHLPSSFLHPVLMRALLK